MQLTQEQQALLSNETYLRIFILLRHGENNAIQAEQIVAATSLKERTVRKYMEAMRDAELVVLSSDKGYFLPANAVEIRNHIKKTSAAAKSLFKSLRAAKKLLREWERQ